MKAYYNDVDKHAAAWLRELIRAGLIMDGDVDERSIADVRATDLDGYERVHFFAGIGGWDYALRLAGWSGPVWTGSCPCQPFSSAGRRGGASDERHLWPEFCRLIAECRPPVVFGEQVASKAGRSWLAGVRADLGSLAYAVGAADLCAAGVGAPHIRQRLYWVADAGCGGVRDHGRELGGTPGEVCGQVGQQRIRSDAGDGGGSGGLGLATSDRPQGGEPAGTAAGTVERDAMPGGVGDAEGIFGRDEREDSSVGGERRGGDVPDATSSPRHWNAYDLIPCRDGKSRRVEPGTFPLVAGLPRGVVPSGDPSLEEVQATGEARVMRLRGYGNAIAPPLAAEFVRAYSEVLLGVVADERGFTKS